MTSQKHDRPIISIGDNTATSAESEIFKHEERREAPKPRTAVTGRGGRGAPTTSVIAAWDEAYLQADDETRRTVAPFGGWCVQQGIRPLDVNTADAARYAAEHLSSHEQKSGTQTVRRLFDTWNERADALGVRAVDPPLPRAERDHYCQDRETFSEGVRHDLDELRSLWMSRPVRGHVLDEKGAHRREYQILLALSAYCMAKRIDPQSISSLRDFLVPERVRVSLRFILDRAKRKDPDAKKTVHAYEVARILSNIVIDLFPSDAARRKNFDRIQEKLRPPTKARLTPRKQRSVSPFVEPEFARAARNVAYNFYTENAADAAGDRVLATQLMAACAAELFLATSMWPCEVAGLHLTRDITAFETESGLCYAFRTKRGDEAREYAIGTRSAGVLHTYLTRVRPHRPGADSEAVFPGRGGSTHHPAALARSVSHFIHDQLQHRIPASDLPDANVVAVGTASADNDKLLREFMGRIGDQTDPLINTIRTWRTSRRADEEAE